MSRSLRLPALLASVVVATSVLAVPASAAPPTAVVAPALLSSSVTGWSTTAVTMKLGGEVSSTVTVKPAAVRTVLVQLRKGTTGTVSTKATLTTSSTGRVTARVSPTSTGTWYARLSAKATSTAAAVTTAWRKITVSGTAGSTSVTTPTVSPSTVLRPAKQTISATVKPAGARSVEVWAKAPGSSTYTLRGSTTSSSTTGVAKLTWSAPSAGTWTYRVYVRPTLTLKGVTSSTRTATVTDLPAQVGDLQAVAGPEQVALSWTNPTAFFAKVVVRRTGLGETPPTKPSEGTAVPLASDTATSVTVTGLTFNYDSPLTYDFWVFTLDSAGRAGTPATVSAAPKEVLPGPVSAVTVDVSQSPTSATLQWTNPSAHFSEVRVRRTLASDPAPENAFLGDEVTLASVTATSVTDTGLAAGTEYRWTFFPISPSGAPGEAFSVTATTMTAALVWASAQKAVPMQGGLQAISCPTATFCVAADQYSNVLVRSGGGWTGPTPVPGVTSLIRGVSCATDLVCVLVDYHGDVVVRAADGSFSTPVHLTESALFSVGCTPGGSFCLVGDVDGKVYRSSDRATWSSGTVVPTGGAINDISCVTSAFCALTGPVGRTWTFSGVVAGVPQISLDVQKTEELVDAVDCVSTTFCVYVSQIGEAWVRGGSPVPLGSTSQVTDVSCAGETYCRAVDYAGYVFTFDGSTWASTRPDPRAQWVGVACPTSTACVTVDGGGPGWANVWNGTSWSGVDPVDPYSGTTAVSCTSASFCAVVDQAGRAATYDGTTWAAPLKVSYPGTLTLVECASATRCFASGYTGEVYAFDGSAWTLDAVSSMGERVYDIACPTASWCVLITDANRYATWNGSTWTALTAIDDSAAPRRIQCATATYCMAADQTARQVRIFDGSAWGLWNEAPVEIQAFDCAADSLCLAVGGGTQSFTWTGTSWGEPDTGVSSSPALLDCTSSSFCEAVAYSPLDSSTWDGGVWNLAPDSPSPNAPAQDLSCAGFRFCAVVDQAGGVLFGTR